jgi:AcrR family transcriptional regulator
VARMSAEDRRELLTEAAIKVMTREGVARATTRAIAGEAQMPLGIFHYAFGSKHELLVRVIETIARQSKGDIDAAVLTKPDLDLEEVATAGLMAYFDHVVAHPQEHMLTYELTQFALREKGFEGVAKDQYHYYLRENDALLEAFAEIMQIEFVVPLPVVSRFVFSVMDGLALNWLAMGDEEGAREVVRLAVRTLETLVRPRQERPGQGPDDPGDLDSGPGGGTGGDEAEAS